MGDTSKLEKQAKKREASPKRMTSNVVKDTPQNAERLRSDTKEDEEKEETKKVGHSQLERETKGGAGSPRRESNKAELETKKKTEKPKGGNSTQEKQTKARAESPT